VTPGEHAKRAEEIAAGLSGLPAAQVHALLAVAGEIAMFGDTVDMAVRLMAASDHPPVPEQAATPAQAELITECQSLWAGWAPGLWPVPDQRDPRGWCWADPMAGAG
jgi:class 3 adenylate cyclase